jgi:hypothetical protein
MKNLAHSASFESFDKDAPSKPGTKPPRIAYGGSVVVSAVVIEDSLCDPTNAALGA